VTCKANATKKNLSVLTCPSPRNEPRVVHASVASLVHSHHHKETGVLAAPRGQSLSLPFPTSNSHIHRLFSRRLPEPQALPIQLSQNPLALYTWLRLPTTLLSPHATTPLASISLRPLNPLPSPPSQHPHTIRPKTPSALSQSDWNGSVSRATSA